MSGVNPYSSSEYDLPPVSAFPSYQGVGEIRRVRIRNIELLKRGYALMGDQYGLFVGMIFIAILIGSVVPFGILMAPMMVGIYLCFMHREAGYHVEFGTLFKGFDKFQEAIIAFLILVAASMAFFVVFGGLFLFIFFQMLAPNGQLAEPALVILLALYLGIIFGSMLLYIPFLFAFQLIADRGLSGLEAVKVSWAGAKENLGGILLFMIVNMFFSFLTALMCYLPLFLFMPISFGAFFVLYRDIYGDRTDAIHEP